MLLVPGGPPVFPPVVPTHLVKLACELPEQHDRSLSLWTCAELARALVLGGLVDSISPQTVRIPAGWTVRSDAHGPRIPARVDHEFRPARSIPVEIATNDVFQGLFPGS